MTAAAMLTVIGLIGTHLGSSFRAHSFLLFAAMHLVQSSAQTPTSFTDDAVTFNVSAYIGTFSGQTIDCGEIENCYILCNEPSGCSEMTINASMTTNLVLECGAESACSGFDLLSPGPSDHFNITCYGHSACSWGDIEVMDTNRIDIDCDSNVTSDDTATCNGLDVFATNAMSFKIECRVDGGCNNLNLQFQNVSDYQMQCHYGACYSALINISDADSVDIGCESNDDTLCLQYSEFHFENAGDITMHSMANSAFRWNEVFLYGEEGSFSMFCQSSKSCVHNNIFATDYHSRYDLMIFTLSLYNHSRVCLYAQSVFGVRWSIWMS